MGQLESSIYSCVHRWRDSRDYSPNPEGTLLPDGSRWGPFRGATVIDPWKVFEDFSLELLASNFRWTEGPTYIKETGGLLFSDTIEAKIYYWDPNLGVSTLVKDSGGFDGSNVTSFESIFEPGGNGMTRKGDWIYLCQHCTRRVVRLRVETLLEQRGAWRPPSFCELPFEVLASETPEGRSFNSPNDIIAVDDDDNGPDVGKETDDCLPVVYFTDPIYGFLKKQLPGLGYAYLNAEQGLHPDQSYLDECSMSEGAGCKGVYRIRKGRVELVTKAMTRPNGLALTPDKKTLWVCNSAKEGPSWWAFALESPSLPLAPLRSLDSKNLMEDLDPTAERPGASDGFRIDSEGRLWTTIPGGLAVIDPSRNKVLAKVMLNTNTSNVEFAADGSIFITGLGHLWRLTKKLPPELA